MTLKILMKGGKGVTKLGIKWNGSCRGLILISELSNARENTEGGGVNFEKMFSDRLFELPRVY